MKLTLEQVLQGQDYDAKLAAVKFLTGEETDPITQVIGEAFLRGEKQQDFDQMMTDLEYAIAQLKKAHQQVKDFRP